MDNSDLGNRMKGYEKVPRMSLTPRMPMIIRVDGRAFHTFTRPFKATSEGPWSIALRNAMTSAAKALIREISGARLAYVQSDEISVLVTDYETFNTQPWFDKGIQKICSVAASIATVGFNTCEDLEGYNWATFDARCFVLPKEEVTNYFIWRQQDATKNSVSMLAQDNFSHKQLQGKNGSQMQDMLMLEKGINWNNCEIWQKRGWCVTRNSRSMTVREFIKAGNKVATSPSYDVDLDTTIRRTFVEPDWEIPIFTKDRFYVEQFV